MPSGLSTPRRVVVRTEVVVHGSLLRSKYSEMPTDVLRIGKLVQVL
jgi:hypothetical protein